MKDGTRVLPKNRKLQQEIESCWRGHNEPPAVAGGLELAEWPAPELEIRLQCREAQPQHTRLPHPYRRRFCCAFTGV